MMTKTKKALSSLDFAIDQCRQTERHDDEFTIVEYMERVKATRCTAQRFLEELIKKGSLTKRKISIDGHIVNLYRKP